MIFGLWLTPSAEFRIFVEQAEQQLWQLFQTMDRDHNGRLDKAELRLAFEKAGISIDEAKLVSFFDRMDSNQDGEISFSEWRYDHEASLLLSSSHAFKGLPPLPTDPQPEP